MNVSSQQVHLNSANATYTSHGKFVFFFDDVIMTPRNVHMEVSLVNATFPMSFYVVNDDNNTLKYDSSTFSIPVGNYSITELRNLLRTISLFTDVVYSRITNRLTISANQPFTIHNSSTCLKLIGLTNDDHSSVNNTIVSNSVVNLSGISSIYIHSNLLTKSIDSRTGGYSNLLARVPIDATRNGFLNFSPDNSFRSQIANRTIDFIAISIEDDINNMIDFNNQEWVLTLQFDFQYTRNSTPDT
jgi:hypothetical protein